MNRELRFRIWNGSEMVYDVTVGKFGVFYVNQSNNGLDENDSASLTPFTTKYSDTTPVMQMIGERDKSGNELYENDIVVTDEAGWKAKIIFDNGRFMCVDNIGGFSSHCNWNEFEKIGDVYSSPDLLK